MLAVHRRSHILMILLVLGALAAPVFAEEAAITIVGRKGAPAQIIDNTTGVVTEQDPDTLRMNVVSPVAMEDDALRAAEESEVVKEDEAKDAEAAKAEAARKKQEAEAAAKAEAASAKTAAEKAKLEKAEAEMKGMGWINQTEDGKFLFNPNTMQFRPRDEVVKEFLPPDPGEKSAPPKPRGPAAGSPADDSGDGPF
jgi:hypothetical protein